MPIEEQITMQVIQRLEKKISDVTLRDVFAMSVIQTQVNNYLYDNEIEEMVRRSYRIADIMLKVRCEK